jgi:hypothetical protein
MGKLVLERWGRMNVMDECLWKSPLLHTIEYTAAGSHISMVSIECSIGSIL